MSCSACSSRPARRATSEALSSRPRHRHIETAAATRPRENRSDSASPKRRSSIASFDFFNTESESFSLSLSLSFSFASKPAVDSSTNKKSSPWSSKQSSRKSARARSPSAAAHRRAVAASSRATAFSKSSRHIGSVSAVTPPWTLRLGSSASAAAFKEPSSNRVLNATRDSSRVTTETFLVPSSLSSTSVTFVTPSALSMLSTSPTTETCETFSGASNEYQTHRVCALACATITSAPGTHCAYVTCSSKDVLVDGEPR